LRLAQRIERFGTCADAIDIWRSLGVAEPQRIPALSYREFAALANHLQDPRHDAR
jgi:malonate decarboxylase beta subunit